jgi:hypothetical protein
MKVWLIPTAIAVCLQLWLNLYVLAHPPVRPIRAACHDMIFAALLFTVGDLLASFVSPHRAKSHMNSERLAVR